jgi:hypothetical protein
MTLDAKQLAGKPIRIGDLKGDPVFQASTKGGLFLIMAKSTTGRARTLGVGPHPATARHIAEKDFPEVNFTELAKSEPPAPELFQAQIQESLWLTRKIQDVTAELEAVRK